MFIFEVCFFLYFLFFRSFFFIYFSIFYRLVKESHHSVNWEGRREARQVASQLKAETTQLSQREQRNSSNFLLRLSQLSHSFLLSVMTVLHYDETQVSMRSRSIILYTTLTRDNKGQSLCKLGSCGAIEDKGRVARLAFWQTLWS